MKVEVYYPSYWRRFLVWLFPRQYPDEDWYNPIIGYALEDSKDGDDTILVKLI